MPSIDESKPFIPVGIAVLTVSDTRSLDEDRSGATLAARIEEAGHRLAAREIVTDDVEAIRAVVQRWIGSDDIDVIITTGGTGFTGRDVTPEALEPLFDKAIDGFGELFRAASLPDIGAATIQSRAFAGLANATVIFCMPGSPGACRTAWEEVIRAQLDARTRPCNLANLMPRFKES